jgi:uncharacterized protein YcbK (DUF882 family)
MCSLQQLLDEHGVTHFAAHELYSREVRGGPKTVVPPAELWPNILDTLALADVIRDRLGAPIHVWSAYRSPAYNRLIGGAKQSEHMGFRALDLHAEDMPKLKQIAAEVMAAADADGMRTGFGVYTRFVHIDTGSPKGRKRRWLGK